MPSGDTLKATLDKAMAMARERDASAIVLATGEMPCFLLPGRKLPVSKNRLDDTHLSNLFQTVLDPARLASLATVGHVRFGLRWAPHGRVHVTCRRWAGGASLQIDLLPLVLPGFDPLNLPRTACAAAATAARGLVLVTGTSAAARAAVLAALVGHRCARPGSALLLDDPQPAYSYEDICGARVVSGAPGSLFDTATGAPDAALAAVLMGDIDDRARLGAALRWSEHALCLAAVPGERLRRLFEWIDDDPAGPGLLHAVADALQLAVGIVALNPDGAPQLFASEVLPVDAHARAALRQGELGVLFDRMQEAPAEGMRTRDQHLLQLVAERRLGQGDALRHAERPDTLGPALASLHPTRIPDDWDPFGESLSAGGRVHRTVLGMDSMLAPDLPSAPRPGLAEAAPAAADPLQDLAYERTLFMRPAASVPAPGKPDAVQFRVYTPAQVAPGEVALLDLWACLPSQAAEVAALAASTPQNRQAGLRAGVALQRGVWLSLRLDSAALSVRCGPQSMLWDGEPCNVGFEFTVLPSQAPGWAPARVHLAAEGIPLGQVNFMLRVQGQPAPEELQLNPSARARFIRSAFASYAAPDRPEVLARIQGMKKIAPDLDVFVDALGLHSGERWQQRLEEELRQRERLFLFWSRQASQSEWVDFEWRLVQRLKGLDAIDPVPLDDPSTVPPPAELSALHFGDAFIAHIRQARQHPSP